MFGALSQGATLYVLDKTNGEPRLGIATVSAKTEMPAPNALWSQQLPNATVDLTVAFADGTTNTFTKLPSAASTYAYEKAIVTETRELMQQHVENAIRQSKSVLESVDYHKKAIASYEEMMKQLSPSFAKEKETDERLNLLEKGLGDIKSILVKMSSNNSGKYQKD